MIPLHPMLVHFPVALVVFAGILALAAWIWNKPRLHRIARVNLIIGTVCAILTVISGMAAAGDVFTIDPQHNVLERHQLMAAISLVLLVVLSVWAILKQKDWALKVPTIFTIVLLIAHLSVAGTAFYGAKLVYSHGVGVDRAALSGIHMPSTMGSIGYRCPVHRELTSANPGLCPECGVRMIPILDIPQPKKAKNLGEN